MNEAERAGLCASCTQHQRIEGARSTFYLCRRASVDPRFPKYPRLPVLACAGFEPAGGEMSGNGERRD